MLAYALAIFTGAFLLFQVQPLIAKFILPWFGGSPGVWTTCLLFFQLLLLGGYAFAHLIASLLGPRGQAIAYGTALLVAMAFLPIVPPEGLKPDADTVPTLRILVLLGVSVGFPYLVLASTSPLMQSWFSRTLPDASPYRLYALSNAGSLLALLSYPFVTEPLLSRQTQAYVWSFAFVTYALLGGYCALRLVRHDASGEAEPETPTAFALAWRPAVSARFLWVLLPACGSLLLLAITNELTIDIAPVPFLWVLPLSIYLLTFIISFDHERWYSRPVFFAALVGCLIAILPMLGDTVDASLGSQIAALSISLFVFCMICHGELARHKPPARFLTSYYLSIAAGGALGSLFVAVVAPLIFTAYLELHIGLVLCCLLFMASVWTSPRSWLHGGRPRWAWIAMALVLLAFGATLTVGAATELAAATEMSRNFYGVLSITDVLTGTPGHTVKLNHGRILHGLQFVHAARTLFPTSYYGGLSGAGLALRAFPRQGARRIGLVGLGVGTLTAYSRPGEYVRGDEGRTLVIHRDLGSAAPDVGIGAGIVLCQDRPGRGIDLVNHVDHVPHVLTVRHDPGGVAEIVEGHAHRRAAGQRDRVNDRHGRRVDGVHLVGEEARHVDRGAVGRDRQVKRHQAHRDFLDHRVGGGVNDRHRVPVLLGDVELRSVFEGNARRRAGERPQEDGLNNGVGVQIDDRDRVGVAVRNVDRVEETRAGLSVCRRGQHGERNDEKGRRQGAPCEPAADHRSYLRVSEHLSAFFYLI